MDIEHFRTALLEERKRVVDAIEYLKKETPGSLEDETEESSGVENHLADQAAGRSTARSTTRSRRTRSRCSQQIDAALARIEAGTYGICERGDKPIAEERLEARPWATLCIDHQRELERG